MSGRPMRIAWTGQAATLVDVLPQRVVGGIVELQAPFS